MRQKEEELLRDAPKRSTQSLVDINVKLRKDAGKNDHSEETAAEKIGS